MLSACETGAEAVSDLSDTTPTETLSNVSKRFSQEGITDSDSTSSSFNMSQPAPNTDHFRVCSYFSSSEPVLPLLPHFSRDFISPQSFSEFHIKQAPALSLSLIPGGSTAQITSDTPMEPSVTEPPSSSKHSRPSNLLRSLTHQPDSLESDGAAAHVSDLYISESETQDFILDPQEIQCPEYQPLSQTGGTNVDRHTQGLMCDTDNVVTLCHSGPGKAQSIVDYESGASQCAKPPAADACEAGLMSVNDEKRRKAEVTKLTTQPRRSHSPIELWLDACQDLAGEDTGDRNVPVQGGDVFVPPGETKVSDCNFDGRQGIGCSRDDTRGWGPPVERWSSIDSWASALSDWTGIIAAPQEDFTAAFTEIGAEIDALTQALAEVKTQIERETHKDGKGHETVMGVQDQPLEVQIIPESSVLAGQSCLSLCQEAPGDREDSWSRESLCEPEEIQSERAERSPCQTLQQLPTGSPSAPVNVTPGSHAALNLSYFGGFAESDAFINNEEDPIILNIREDTDLEEQNMPGKLMIEEPFGDEVREVTDEHSVFQLVTQQEVKRSAEVDPQGAKPSTNFLGTHTPTNSHVPGVHKQPGLHVDAHVSPDTLPNLDRACQVEPQRGSPRFIMPLAPLSILALSSLVCQTSSSLEGDQTCAKRSLIDNRDPSCVQPCTLWPNSDRITVETSLDGDELIHKKGNTLKSAEKSSPEGQTTIEETELSNPTAPLISSERNHVAYITLDLNDPFASRALKPTGIQFNKRTAEKMPHKTHKSSESKARSKKDRTAAHHHSVQVSKKQENLSHVSAQQVSKQQDAHPLSEENHTSENTQVRLQDKEVKLVIETSVATEKAASKQHGKKKKKHTPNVAGAKTVVEPLAEVENGAKPKTAKGRIEMFEAKLGAKTGRTQKHSEQAEEKQSQQPEDKAKPLLAELTPHRIDHKDHQPKKFTSTLNDDIIKRRRLSEDTFGKTVSVLESKLPKPDVSKAEEPKEETMATRKKAYSEVVKQKSPPKEEPKVAQPIQVVSVSGDPQSLCLWCQFAAVFSHHTVTWSRGDAVLSESKRSAGDESRVSLTVSNASHKDLGKYQCRLTSLHGSVTLDYQLTYEVLSEIVIPSSPKPVPAAPVEVGGEEEDVQCSRLIFKDDFLSDQQFGENQPVSIITEKVHFGEGMHRRAFRTRMQAGRIPLLVPGHACVLKVHNSISYGTKDNDELVQKNFSLAVEECHVQNTAREYIKAYSTAAQAVEAFGETPEIIPIYLVHRPSNNIPYATLEEELIGDFVKYSVKDGKEINLMRRDSEAGQKCCAFQHWVYHKTEGNLLVTDMQGVGMRLTDVGIATCKKGYKGFKGNCATSFIDQFKALHQCNKYCEILGLKSLQPKPKKPAPKPKPPISAAPKKKTFGPTLNGKTY